MSTSSNNPIVWPPIYTVKKHPRARRVKLKTSAQRGLEIVVPPRFNLKLLDKVLEDNKSWIETKLREIAKKSTELPDEIYLPALNLKWKIFYFSSKAKRVTLLSRFEQELILMGNIENKVLCKKVLNEWVKEQAKKYLSSTLQHYSQLTQLVYENIIIRNQRTRWGSCSTNKTISLNYKLIFLPERLSTHVVLHELCHLKYLNHSARFWQLLAKHDPESDAHNRELRTAEKFIPDWV